MKVLGHRGWWTSAEEKNSLRALERAFAGGFGVETDIRDRLGELVVSHDMPRGVEPTLREFLALASGLDVPIALNIKSDGLAGELEGVLADYEPTNFFAFDMSVPDSRDYLSRGLPVFLRVSELEPFDTRVEGASGIWLDSFESTWFDTDAVSALLAAAGAVCVVSPELHARDYADCWKTLRPLAQESALYLCTDYPAEARSYFGDE